MGKGILRIGAETLWSCPGEKVDKHPGGRLHPFLQWAAFFVLPAYAILSIALTLLSLSNAKAIQANFWLHHTHALIILSCVLIGYLYGLSH